MSPLWRVLTGGFLLLGSVTVWFLFQSGSHLPPPTVAPTLPLTTGREGADQDRTELAPAPPAAVLAMPRPAIPAPVSLPERHSTAAISVLALEQRIRATRGVEERTELITELARSDSAEAILALERLFTVERHPKVQTALVASLVDVDRTVQPDARLRILCAALANQPREVRTTALEVLAESDEQSARELLRRASISDPDHEVREVAAALYQANSR